MGKGLDALSLLKRELFLYLVGHIGVDPSSAQQLEHSAAPMYGGDN